MDILQGNPAGLRSAASDVAALRSTFEALDGALTEVIAHTDDAGNLPAGHKLRQVLVTMRSSVRDGMVKQNDAKHAIEGLAATLETLDHSARQMSAIPTLAGTAVATECRRRGNQERSEVAGALLRCLPDGVPGRQVEYPGVGTTLKHVFERGVKEPAEGILGLVKFGWDTHPVRAVVDFDGYSRTMRDVVLNGHALYDAVVNDRFPDGSTGARRVVQDALSAIPDDVLNNDLIDSDPAAWWMLYGLTALSLFSGAGGAKVGPKVLTSLSKGAGKAADVSKLGGVAVRGAQLSDEGSALSKVLAEHPGLLGRIVRPNSPVPADIWISRYPGDYQGRLAIEELVLSLVRKGSPGIVQTKRGHDVIDLMDVSLIETSTGRIISVKSLDPALGGYQAKPSQIGSTLFNDAEKLRTWATPSTPGGTGVPFIRDPKAFGSLGAEKDTVFFMGDDLLTRDLYLALPDDGFNAAQAASLEGDRPH